MDKGIENTEKTKNLFFWSMPGKAGPAEDSSWIKKILLYLDGRKPTCRNLRNKAIH